MSEIPLAAFDEKNTHRLIAQAYADEPAVAPLADDAAEIAILTALEARTSGRLMAERGELDEVTPGELLTPDFGYGHSFVNAALVYTRAGGNRFNGEGRGAWYAGLEIETSLAEIAFHLDREIRNAGGTDNRSRYVQLIAHVEGWMADLHREPGHPCLDPDPAKGYPEGQKVAREVRARGGHGIAYPSVRRAGGNCVAVFSTVAFRKVTRGGGYLLEWKDGKGPEIREG
ncbi:RES family NAD+ phosphorylase [Oricola cellulosilytica]|uniref:RES domain-containing protein n=1 Tax=Oricola cellulosilytica TaxID=1429082 RepID=A0A4R0PAR3_9HYPH|nr:RES family NAD+ phosphorylase [Oricola cellulosilytica]TCD14126.1 RES domain-containing protein [Oricola cellulosilytica]